MSAQKKTDMTCEGYTRPFLGSTTPMLTPLPKPLASPEARVVSVPALMGNNGAAR